MDIKRLLQGLNDQPDDVIIAILNNLPPSYIKQFFVNWKTKQLVLEEFYNHRELHLITSQLIRSKHVCALSEYDQRLHDFDSFDASVRFLRQYPEVIPRKLVLVAGHDKASLYKFISMFSHRFSLCQELEVVIDECKPSLDHLEKILKLPNLTRLQLSRFTSKECESLIIKLLPQASQLTTIQFLAHAVYDWSAFKFPDGLKSLDCSWNEMTNIGSLQMPPNLQELYLNKAGLRDDNIMALQQRFPCGLKTLMMTYNEFQYLDTTALPDSIEKLDVSRNHITYFRDNKPTMWSSNMRELNLGFNGLTSATFQAIAHNKWPRSLGVLNLESNGISNIYVLKDLPDSLEELDVSSNRLQYRVNPTTYKFTSVKFPDNLKRLCLDGNLDLAVVTFPTDSKIELPPNLEELSAVGCGIDRLDIFDYPKSLKILNLGHNMLYELYPVCEWEGMDNLETLILSHNHIEDLRSFVCPPSVLRIDFTGNAISKLSGEHPMFNHEYNKNLKFHTLKFAENRIYDVSTIQIPNRAVTLDLRKNWLPLIFHLGPELVKLYSLDVTQNGIIEITGDAATEPQRLSKLYFQDKSERGSIIFEDLKFYEELERAVGHEIYKGGNIDDIDLRLAPDAGPPMSFRRNSSRSTDEPMHRLTGAKRR